MLLFYLHCSCTCELAILLPPAGYGQDGYVGAQGGGYAATAGQKRDYAATQGGYQQASTPLHIFIFLVQTLLLSGFLDERILWVEGRCIMHLHSTVCHTVCTSQQRPQRQLRTAEPESAA